MKAMTMAYKPLGWALGAAGGMAAAAIFGQAWKLLEGSDDAPDATDEDRGWSEILLAAALQGAIFSVVKAAVDRTGAVVVRRLTS